MQNNNIPENEKLSQIKAQNSNSNLNMHILFLSDLPNNVSEDDIKALFKDYIEKIKHISINPSNINQNTIKPKSPSATVILSDSKIAEIAKNNLNLRKIKGKSVRIMWHTKDKKIIENSDSNVYIKNIPDFVTPRDVLEHFSQFGEITSAKIPENDEGNHLGFGYINYSNIEAAQKAINSENGKKVWNSIVEVQPFINLKERANTLLSNNSCILYLREFPENYNEENILEICKNFGEITNCRIIRDSSKPHFQTYAVLFFINQQSTEKVKLALNNIQIEGKFLKAENYKTKEEKIASETSDNFQNKNSSLPNYNSYFISSNNPNNNFLPKGLSIGTTNNNLHIRNIPFDATENDLINCFSHYGEIKSAKIEKINLVTKVGEEYKEIPKSQGFGYVCFIKHEDALKAKEALDGKFLPKYEMWKRPLLIDFFMPKSQRKNLHNKNFSSQGRNDFNLGIETNENIPNTFYNANSNMMIYPQFSGKNLENISFHQQQQINMFASAQPKILESQIFYSNQGRDVFNLQQMLNNLPTGAPSKAQSNVGQYPQQLFNNKFNNMNYAQIGNMHISRGQINQQFYGKNGQPIQLQNINLFPNSNQNMIYSKNKKHYL